MPRRKYDLQQVKEAAASSVSIAQLLTKLNVKPSGGNYRVIQKYLCKNNVDISHFTGQGHNKGKVFGPKRPIEDYLSNQYPIASNGLKKRLIVEGYLERKCYKCNLQEWFGQPIPIELEHIDGNHLNNSLNNLTLLCPNCHAQTTTYRGKNKKPKS